MERVVNYRWLLTRVEVLTAGGRPLVGGRAAPGGWLG
jgi:hypothetical protein